MDIDVPVPDGKLGNFRVESFEVSETQARLFNVKNKGREIVPGNFKRLCQHNQVIMSNTPAEIKDHLPLFYQAQRQGGHILLNGLGLGVCVSKLLDFENVKSVTVYEKEQDVIDLVAPSYMDDPRFKVVRRDALTFRPTSESFFDIANPGAGHLAYSYYMDQGQIGDDYLYRNEVPGNPEVNRMTTELDMDGNTINMGDGDVGGGDEEGVRKVNFEDHDPSDFSCADHDDDGGSVFYDRSDGLYVCREGKKQKIADQGNEGFLQNTQIATNGDSIAKPDCSPSTTPQIFVSPVAFSRNTSGEDLKAVQAYAQESGTDWTVHLRVLTKSGWKYPSSSYGRLMVITKCS